jgi:hypothetical protein
MAIYNTNRIARSVESKTRIELNEAKRKIEKLENQVKELQSLLLKYTFTSKQKGQLEMNADKDPIMQNINVLIKVAQRSAEKAT